MFDYLTSFPAPQDRLVKGVVVRREIITYRLGNKLPRVTVKIDGSPVLVIADLSMNGHDKIPEVVTFYYSGDPHREVHLLQEGNLLLGAIVCWIWPGLFLLVTFVTYRSLRSKTRSKHIPSAWAKCVVDEL